MLARQVQDLERQLQHAKSQIQHLSGGPGNPSAYQDYNSSPNSRANTNDGYLSNSALMDERSQPSHAQGSSESSPNYRNVRKELKMLSRNLFKLPSAWRDSSNKQIPLPRLELPDRQLADHLLQRFFDAVQFHLPLFHWPSFVGHYKRIYDDPTLQSSSQSFLSSLFLVFAVGTLFTSAADVGANRPLANNSSHFLRIANSEAVLFHAEHTLDDVRNALLTSIYMVEENNHTSTCAWAGVALRLSYDLSLHRENDHYKGFDCELRRRLWWCVYLWDRQLQAELGRPVEIDDADCNVPFPRMERFTHQALIGVTPNRPSGPAFASNLFVPSLYVARLIGPLVRTIQAACVPASALEAFDSHFLSCWAAFAPEYRPNHHSSLDPQYLASLFLLQNLRLMLHRHNLSPATPPEERAAALEACVSVSKDTAILVERVLNWYQPADEQTGMKECTWQVRMANSATSAVCTHLWRCTLFLCLRGLWHVALPLVRASKAIGDCRLINVGVGKYTWGFFCFANGKKLRNWSEEPKIDDMDDEVLCLATGDLQGTEHAWNGLWIGDLSLQETEAELPKICLAASEYDNALRSKTVLDSNADDPVWVGWDKVEAFVIEKVALSTRIQQRNNHATPHILHPSESREHSSIDPLMINFPPPSSETVPGSNTKMSIANFIRST